MLRSEKTLGHKGDNYLIDEDFFTERSFSDSKFYFKVEAMKDAGGDQEEQARQMEGDQDKLVEEIFSHEDKDKDGLISHEEFSGPKHDEL